ncbi:MAG: hexokinase [Tannerella sp.]|jgi:hexokinase|nr:hexokinase [Tannerella sp.]
MEKNIFELHTGQLKEISQSFQEKVEAGLSQKYMEVQCIPTFIRPKTNGIKGEALVLSLGGTNCRAATVDFNGEKPVIHPENGFKKDLSIMRTPGFTEKDLFKEQADLINEIRLDKKMPIGYCFSYPAESMLDGDAKLIRWTKGVDIRKMLNKPVGKPLLEYLNGKNGNNFTYIKVINDTIASLFSSLTYNDSDAYIGLIVGTGTNMATFINANKIKKLDPMLNQRGLIPVNLESGNFLPPHLTSIDNIVDALSNSKGAQRFEKAVSGMYLGEILKAAFPMDEFEKKFDTRKLTKIMNYPDLYKDKYVQVAHWIYQRSAQLVAASLAGLILVLYSHNNSIGKIRLVAEGSIFWSTNRNGKSYKSIVMDELRILLNEFGLNDIQVLLDKIDNANLIGTAIAALS